MRPLDTLPPRTGKRAHRNRAHRLAYVNEIAGRPEGPGLPTGSRTNLPLLTRVTVTDVERLSPTFVRIELGGTALVDFGVDSSPLYDQRVKLLFPPASGRLPDIGSAEGWHREWSALPEDRRGHLRTFTVRGVRGSGILTRIVVDFVLHLAPGFTGPAARWAAAARTGDELFLVAPRRGVPFGGIEFAPPRGHSLLLAGDESAVPAISSILASTPDGTPGVAFLEVPKPLDILHARCPLGMKVVWLARQSARPGSRLLPAVAAHLGSVAGGPDRQDPQAAYGEAQDDLWETPTYSSSGEPLDPVAPGLSGVYAWVAGETGLVASLRRHLVGEVGLSRRQTAFMGYWRQGVAMRD